MKVLIISEHYHPIVGGSTTYVINLCKNLAKIGCDVYLVTRPDDMHENEKWYIENGINIFHIDVPKSFRKDRYFPIFLYRKINYLVQYVKPDVVHIGYGFFAPLAIMLNQKIRKIQIIWTVHNVPPTEHIFDFFKNIQPINHALASIYFKVGDLYSQLIFRITGYDKIICVSRKTADLAISKGVPEKKIQVIPNAIDADLYDPNLDISSIKKQLGFEKYSDIVLTVAGIIPHKGQDIILKAVPDVLSRYPDTLFLIVGPVRSEAYYNELVQFIRDLNIENNVKIVSGLTSTELSEYYHISDVYVQPSLEEGFCISILEAMSYSKPVIGTKTGAIPEFIQCSEGGILVDFSAPDQTSNAIIGLLNNPNNKESLGKKGRNYVVKNFSWEQVAIETMNEYQKCIISNSNL